MEVYAAGQGFIPLMKHSSFLAGSDQSILPSALLIIRAYAVGLSAGCFTG